MNMNRYVYCGVVLSGMCLEAAPKIRARSGLMMAGLGDRQDERKEQEARFDGSTSVYG